MEITPTTIIIVGVVCVVLGFLASVLLNTLSDDNETSTAPVDEAPPGGRKGRYTPVVRLWRERGSGNLVVEMDGKSMVSPEPLNEIQRERLEKSARELRAWLGMGLAGKEVIETEKEPVQPEIDLDRVIKPAPVKPAPAQTPPPAAPAQKPAPAPVSYSPPPAPVPAPTRGPVVPPPAQKGKDEPAAKPAPAAKSIVMQIEDILQDMIAGTPLAQRGVHLMEDPTRGVIVQIGLDRYEGIDAVPDPEIKGVIRSAVQEWEQSQ